MTVCETNAMQSLKPWSLRGTWPGATRRAGRAAPRRSVEPRPDAPEREIRRRELAALLEEIRDPSPQPADTIQAVREATEGKLSQDGLGRIEARIAALYEAG